MLLIDTSTNACTVAYHCSQSQSLFSRQVVQPQGHTKLILPLIDEVLAEAGVTKQAIDKVAFVEGPGSFTGLRIGVSVAQGIAYACNAQVLPISSYECLAHQFRQLHDLPVIVVGDARMGDLYVRDMLDSGNDELQAGEQFATRLKGYGLDKKFAIIDPAKIQLQSLQLDQFYVDGFEYCDAQSMAAIALSKPQSSWLKDAQSAQPQYLRNEVNWQKRIKKVDAWANRAK